MGPTHPANPQRRRFMIAGPVVCALATAAIMVGQHTPPPPEVLPPPEWPPPPEWLPPPEEDGAVGDGGHLPASAPAPGLRVEPMALDLGEVRLGSDVEITFTVHNSTDEQVQLLEILSDCGCAVLGDGSDAFMIRPHESATLPLRVRAPRRSGQRVALKVRFIFDPSAVVEIAVTGETVDGVALESAR